MSTATPPAKTRLQFDFAVTNEEMDLFRKISGDHNPVHDEHAVDYGMDQPIVFCGLLVAKVSFVVGENIPGHGCVCQRLKLDFRNPLLIGETATLTAELRQWVESLDCYIVDINIRAGDKVVAEGTVQTLRRTCTATPAQIS